MSKDIEILRELAKKVAEIANLPEMEQRKKAWVHFNGLRPSRPMVLCFPEGAWSELLPADALLCEDGQLRAWEWALRQKIYWWENLRDDNVIEPFFDMGHHVAVGDFGLTTEYIGGENKGSYSWKPSITNLEQDLEKLKFRTIQAYPDGTKQALDTAGEIFGDILPPRVRGNFWWSLGLTETAIKMLGLEEFMYAMYDEPQNLHALMDFLSKEALNYIETLEKMELLSANTGCDYVGSGGVGATDLLPNRTPARLCNMWGFCESQETVGVSPAMFAEFVLPYQMPILEKFGLNCYGCCEPLHERWEYIKTIPNLRRVSVSPWCDVLKMSAYLKGDYVFSCKPNPSYVCTGFDENAIRRGLRQTMDVCKNNVLEIIMKDTHTVQNDPKRLSRWV